MKTGGLLELLNDRDAHMAEVLYASGLSATAKKAFRDFIATDMRARKETAKVEQYLDADERTAQPIEHIQQNALLEDRTRAQQHIKDLDNTADTLLDVERKLSSVPDAATLEQVLTRRREMLSALDEAHGSVSKLDEKLAKIRKDIDQRESELAALLETQAKLEIEQEDVQRYFQHSGRVQQTLAGFRKAVIERHIGRLEHLIADSFKQLMRKDGLVTAVRIHPDHFTLSLVSRDGRTVQPERLSAGERQLLAVSMLWGLGRASGRPLPTAIDTPLGRLDSAHRSHLIERYFPSASHQVILLSTDEEIRGEYLEQLAPRIGRSLSHCLRL